MSEPCQTNSYPCLGMNNKVCFTIKYVVHCNDMVLRLIRRSLFPEVTYLTPKCWTNILFHNIHTVLYVHHTVIIGFKAYVTKVCRTCYYRSYLNRNRLQYSKTLLLALQTITMNQLSQNRSKLIINSILRKFENFKLIIKILNQIQVQSDPHVTLIITQLSIVES